eukprot:4856743-Amphidinium_carterae.1
MVRSGPRLLNNSRGHRASYGIWSVPRSLITPDGIGLRRSTYTFLIDSTTFQSDMSQCRQPPTTFTTYHATPPTPFITTSRAISQDQATTI